MTNYDKLKNPKNTWNFLRHEYEIFKIKKEKLKLGKVVFEIERYVIDEIVVFEKLEMIYSRQDNTDENELKIENRLKALDWKWDLDNVGALIIILSIIILICRSYLSWVYFTYFPAFALRPEELDHLIRYNFYFLYGTPPLFKFMPYYLATHWIHEVLSELVITKGFL